MDDTRPHSDMTPARSTQGSDDGPTVRRPWRLAMALAAGFGLLYLATLSRNFSGDTVRYAIKAETQGALAGMDLYHVFNQPLAWLAWQAARLSGLQERALVPIQVPNALAGGAAVGLMFLLARRLGLSTRAALVVGAGLGLSCATWLLSTDGEYVTPGLAMALLPLVLFYGASMAALARPRFAAALGCSLALSGLAFQTNLLLIPVLLWALALRGDLPPAQRRRTSSVMLATALGLYLAGYGLAMGARPGPLHWSDWRLHPGLGLAYGLPNWSSLPHGAYALVRSLVGFPGLSLSDSTRELWAAASGAWRAGFVAWYALAALLFATPLVMALRGRRRGAAPEDRAWRPLLLWALLAAAFAVFWVPGDLSFWVVLLVPWWLLAGRQLGDRPLGAALVALLALVNGGSLVLPNHDASRNQAYHEAGSLAGAMADGDLLMVPVEGRLQVYAYYLTRGSVFVPGAGSDALPPEKRLAANIAKALERTGQRGGRLLVYGWETGAWNGVPGVEARGTLPGGYRLVVVESEAVGGVYVLTR